MVKDEKFAIQHYRTSGKNFEVVCTDVPRTTFIPLSTAKSWHDYFTNISDKGDFGIGLNADMIPLSDNPAAEMAGNFMRLASGTMTIPLTTLAALEMAFPKLDTMTSLKIHIVGATGREITSILVFEELLHLLPQLQQVHVDLIGFEIPDHTIAQVGQGGSMKMECCPKCTAASRTRSISLWKGAYHEYAKTEHFEIPHLAVAFQSGFSQEMSVEWNPTVKYLARAPYPTLFTTYNEIEMKEEMAILATMGAHFTQKGEMNKWRGLCPMLEAMEEVEGKVFYLNQYWYSIGPNQSHI
ncbi:hypothetical protein G7Y89_g8967 [Cudoniella acicularis]|uniref:Mitochondrial splicing suppressor 51-like C-terminal domain-containing protein n=1 Tax=Cudoniella acicularis TaxID=354080 RepID=A0A8H4RFJ8_9HELO|nr:hypothetical protein G7Y89_g8967 [Cudoniella acicularis]